MGGRPIAAAVRMTCDGIQQTLIDGLLGTHRPWMFQFAETIRQGLVVEPVVGALTRDDRLYEVIGRCIQQRVKVCESVTAARPGQYGRQLRP